jgi:hypothetical protein
MICLLQAGKRMGLIMIPILKWIKILLDFPERRSRWRKGLNIALKIEQGTKTLDLPLRGRVGFCGIRKEPGRSSSGFPLLFLPHRVTSNPSSYPFHLRFLSSLIWW